MKVAVLVNGNFHPYLRRETLSENLVSIQKVFSGCDMFYQTWDDEEDRHIFKDIKDIDLKYVSKPDPINYDPYLKAYDNIHPRYFNGLTRVTAPNATELRSRGCFQHISLSKQYDSIPKGYDFYVRVRWDAYFNESFPLKDILTLAEDHVIGIASIPNHPSIIKQNQSFAKQIEKDHYLTLRARRKTLRDHVDRGTYCIINETGSQNDYPYCRWGHYLKDFVIIFKEEDMEGFDIEESYRTKQLYGAEFGWHQILCRKRSHINIDGLVSIYRNIDTSVRTFNKLKVGKLI
jgi:hypothetical protein